MEVLSPSFPPPPQAGTTIMPTGNPGRPRKYQMDEVVEFETSHGWFYGTTVDYTLGAYYAVIRTDRLGRSPYGAVKWVPTRRMRKLEGRQAKRAGINYRGNKRIGGNKQRGCACHCCVHVKGVEPEPQ